MSQNSSVAGISPQIFRSSAGFAPARHARPRLKDYGGDVGTAGAILPTRRLSTALNIATYILDSWDAVESSVKEV